VEVFIAMYGPYDCPDCHCIHDEPAEAIGALRVQCLGCYLDHALRKDELTKTV
jgi:hypothetical protein